MRSSIYVALYYLKNHPLRAGIVAVIGIVALVGLMMSVNGPSTENARAASERLVLEVEASDVLTEQATNPAGIADITPMATLATSCGVSYQLISQWDGGFVTQVTITNEGDAPLDGWSVSWEPETNFAVTTLWNGDYEVADGQITVSDVPWNRVVAPGAYRSFGFQASSSETARLPEKIQLNGEDCEILEASATPSEQSVDDESPESNVPFARYDQPESCQVDYILQSQRDIDFTTDLTISNTGATDLDGWRLAWQFPNDQRVTTVWNGEAVQEVDGQVMITHVAFNKQIAAGDTIALGFTGSYQNENTPPQSVELNGVECELTLEDQRSSEDEE